MKKFIYYLILLFFAVFLNSCVIKVGDGDDDKEKFLHDPEPFDNAIQVSLTPNLSWVYNANGILNFDVYLDTNNPPLNLIAQVSYPYYDVITPLRSNTTYFWKIRTEYEGNTYESDVWRFTTTSGGFLHDPQPPDGAIEVSLTPQLSWMYNSSSNLIFDVYLDTVSIPYNIVAQVYTNTYTVTTPLQSNTTYFWKIRTVFEGNTYVSDIWRFTTITGGLPTNGLIAHYPFNGNANDESGNGHHGYVYYANSTYDRFNYPNKAYSFNGVNSYILVAHSPGLQPTYGLTLSAWFSFAGLNNTGSILAKGSETSAGLYSLKYQSAYQRLDFQINFPYYSLQTVSINASWQVNKWYNVIGTYDGSYLKVYFDGELVDVVNVSSLLGSNIENLMIGRCSEEYFFNGNLDDIRIYSRALNETEIQLLYHEGGW